MLKDVTGWVLQDGCCDRLAMNMSAIGMIAVSMGLLDSCSSVDAVGVDTV